MKGLPSRTREARGFTLVEMIATMVVLSVVGTASVGITWTAIESFGRGSESLRLHCEASVAMERLVRELRAVPLGSDNTPDIQRLSASGVTWEGGARSISLVGDELLYSFGGVQSILCSGVTSFNMTAHDSVGATLALSPTTPAPGTVRRLTLELRLAEGEARAEVRTRVFLRCMSHEEPS